MAYRCTDGNMLCLISVVVISLITTDTSAQGFGVETGIRTEPKDYCRWETFNATCGRDEVIAIVSAEYGRMRQGRCITSDYSLGCYADVLAQLDQRCSGRQHCSIEIPDPELHEIQPCSKDMLAYLSAEYRCIRVEGHGRNCGGNQPVTIKKQAGFLASFLTQQSGVGSSYCPYIIRAPAGQRINISLWDFATVDHSKNEPGLCQVYGRVEEAKRSREITVCGRSNRRKHLYLSKSSEVKVTISSFGQDEGSPHFLLKYDVSGCPDIRTPEYGWVQRTGNTATVGCNYTSERWHLVCRGTTWVGEANNCTKESSLIDPFPYGLMICVVIGVFLGILLGMCMLAMVVACRRRHRKQQERQAHNQNLMKDGQESVLYMGHAQRKLPPGMAGGYSHIYEVQNGRRVGSDGEATLDNKTYMRPEHMNPTLLVRPAQRGDQHIYESPKFLRRDFSEDGRDIPFYHEFDPNMEMPEGYPDVDAADARGRQNQRHIIVST